MLKKNKIIVCCQPGDVKNKSLVNYSYILKLLDSLAKQNKRIKMWIVKTLRSCYSNFSLMILRISPFENMSFLKTEYNLRFELNLSALDE